MKKILFICAVLFCAQTVSVYAIAEEDVTAIAIGTPREEIHSLIGEPQKTSYGYKDTYELNSGGTAILTYYDNALSCGFILIN